MDETLGKAIIELMIQVTGGKKAFSSLRSFFSRVAGQIELTEKAFDGLNKSVAELGTSAKTNDFARGLREFSREAKNATRTFGTLGRNANKVTRNITQDLASAQRGLEFTRPVEKLRKQFNLLRGDIQRAFNDGLISGRERLDSTLEAFKRFRFDSRRPIASGTDIALESRRRSLREIGLSADSAGISRGSRQVTAAVRNLNTEIAAGILNNKLYGSGLFTLSQGLRDIGFQFADVSRQLLIFSAAIVGALVIPTIQFAQFEQATQNVIAVLADLDSTVQQQAGFDLLSERFLRIGEVTEFTATEIATAARELGLAGFSLAEINNSIEDIVNLSSAANIALEKAAKIAVNIGRAFKIDTTNFQRVSDVLTVVATNSNTTVETLGESFKLLAPISSNLGQSLEEVTAALGVLGTAGVSASRAGTALSRFFSELSEKADDFDRVLRSVGSSFDRIDPTKIGLADIVREFERLERTTSFSTVNFFDLFDQRSARAITTLVNQGSDSLDRLAEAARNSAGEAERIRDLRIDTLEGDFRKALSAFQTTLITFGEAIAPVATLLVNRFAALTRAVTEFINFLGPTGTFLVQISITVAGALGGLALAFGALSLVLKATAVVALLGVLGEVLSTLPTILNLVSAGFNTLTASTTTAAAAQATFSTSLAVTKNAILALLTPVRVAVLAIGALAAIFTAVAISTEAFSASKQELIDFNQEIADTTKNFNELLNSVRKLRTGFDLFRNLPELNILQISQLAESGFSIDALRSSLVELEGEFAELISSINQNLIESERTFANGFGSTIRAINPFSAFSLETVGIELDTVSGKIFQIQRQINTFGGEETNFIEIGLNDLDENLQAAVKRAFALQKQIEGLRDISERAVTFEAAFSGGRNSLEEAIETQRENLKDLQNQIEQFTVNIDIARASGDVASLEANTKLLSLAKAQSEQIRSDLVILERNTDLTNEQIELKKSLLVEEKELNNLIDMKNMGENVTNKTLQMQFNLVQGIREELDQQAKTVDEIKRLEKERNDRNIEAERRLDGLKEKINAEGKSSDELELESLKAQREQILADQAAAEENRLKLIEKTSEEIARKEDILRKKQAQTEISDEAKAINDRVKQLRAEQEKLAKQRAELNARFPNAGGRPLDAQMDFAAVDKEIEQNRVDLNKALRDQSKVEGDINKELVKQRSLVKEIFGLRQALNMLRKGASDEEVQRAKDELDLVSQREDQVKENIQEGIDAQERQSALEIKQLELAAAKREGNLKDTIRLTEEIGQLRIKQDLIEFDRQNKNADQRNALQKAKEMELQAELAAIREDFRKKEEDKTAKAAEAQQKNREQLLNLQLRTAQREENLSQILKLTEQIGRIKLDEDIAEFNKNNDNLDDRNKFALLKERELQAELEKIREDFIEKQKRKQEQKDKEGDQQAKKAQDELQKRQLDTQNKIRDALLQQVKSIRDAIALTAFLNKQESLRLRRQIKLTDESARAQERLRRAQASGDQGRIDRIRARAGLLLDRGRIEGLNQAQAGLRQDLAANLGQALGQAPVQAAQQKQMPVVTNKQVNVNFAADSININADGVQADEITPIIQEELEDIFRANGLF